MNEDCPNKVGKPGMIVVDTFCNECDEVHWCCLYPCKNCENGKVAVKPLDYVICPVCKGHGVLR
jgi:hypothetical protein